MPRAECFGKATVGCFPRFGRRRRAGARLARPRQLGSAARPAGHQSSSALAAPRSGGSERANGCLGGRGTWRVWLIAARHELRTRLTHAAATFARVDRFLGVERGRSSWKPFFSFTGILAVVSWLSFSTSCDLPLVAKSSDTTSGATQKACNLT